MSQNSSPNDGYPDVSKFLDKMSQPETNMDDIYLFCDSASRNLAFTHEQVAEKIYNIDDAGVAQIEKACTQIDTSDKCTDELAKFTSSIRLSIVQRRFILDNIKNAGIEAKEIKNTKSGIYTDIVTVLGIFSALVFALFGGLKLFSSITDLKNVRLSRIILLTSLLGLFLIFLVFLLLNGISNITGKQIKACCSKGVCSHSIFQKYPFFAWGSLFCITMMLISFVVILFDYKMALYQWPFNLITIFIISLLVVFFVVVIYKKRIKK